MLFLFLSLPLFCCSCLSLSTQPFQEVGRKRFSLNTVALCLFVWECWAFVVNGLYAKKHRIELNENCDNWSNLQKCHNYWIKLQGHTDFMGSRWICIVNCWNPGLTLLFSLQLWQIKETLRSLNVTLANTCSSSLTLPLTRS